MGNENSSMCACYDNEAERVYAESNIFQRKPLQNKDLEDVKNSQYSYNKSSNL